MLGMTSIWAMLPFWYGIKGRLGSKESRATLAASRLPSRTPRASSAKKFASQRKTKPSALRSTHTAQADHFRGDSAVYHCSEHNLSQLSRNQEKGVPSCWFKTSTVHQSGK